MVRTPAIVLLSLVTAACGVGESGEPLEETLLGRWRCIDGACPDDEMEFENQDGARTYRSWRDGSPAVVDGEWTLDDPALTAVCCGGLRWDYVIVDVDETYLRLREDGREVLFRRAESGGN